MKPWPSAASIPFLQNAGAKLGSELLQSGLVDAFFLYQGAGKIGAKGLLALGGKPEAVLEAGGFILEENCKMGTDRLKRFVRPESLEALYGD